LTCPGGDTNCSDPIYSSNGQHRVDVTEAYAKATISALEQTNQIYQTIFWLFII